MTVKCETTPPKRSRRQEPIGPYIVDFICFDPMLLIELDGSQHTECMAYDSERSAFLEGKGFKVIRFWNHEVLADRIGCAKPLGSASRS